MCIRDRYTTFYWKMYQELAVVATDKHCFTAVEVLKKEDEKRTLRMPSCIEEKQVDGLIVLGEIDKNYIRKLKLMSQVPVVFLDFYDKELAEDAVVTDNFYGMFLMTEFLFEQGIDELGFVGSVFATSSIMDRYCGFMKSMMLHGKNIHPEWVIEDRDEVGQMGFELPKKLPKGFVCNCDLAAVMVLSLIHIYYETLSTFIQPRENRATDIKKPNMCISDDDYRQRRGKGVFCTGQH